MRAFWWVLVVVAAVCGGGGSVRGEEGAWKVEAAGSPGAGYRRMVWSPRGEAPAEGWPVIVWLHGFSLRGDELAKVKEYGLPAVVEKLPAKFVLVAPQLPAKRLVWDRRTLSETLVDACKPISIDRERIYAAGASLGAAGAWEWVAENPKEFAGLVILAGAGNAAKAKQLTGVRVWMFHGVEDRQVPIAKVRASAVALREAGGKVALREVADAGHEADAITQAAFGDAKLLEEMLGTKRAAGGIAATGPAEARESDAGALRAAAGELKARLAVFSEKVEPPGNEMMWAWIKGLCATPHRRPGTEEGHAGEKWVEEQFRALKLENVRSEPVAITVWTAKETKLTVEAKAVPCSFVLNSGFTPAAGVTAELWWGNFGVGKEIGPEAKGKLVVVRARARYRDEGEEGRRQVAVIGEPKGAGTAAAFPYNLMGDFMSVKVADAFDHASRAGAAGLIVLTDDLKGPGTSLYWPYDGAVKSMPAVYVPRKDSAGVEAAAKAGKRATLVLEGNAADGRMSNVWATLPGMSDEVVLVTSHHDAPHLGAVEDASGIAQMLAQAWAWSRVPKEKRPRALVFVAAAGHFQKGKGAYEWAKAQREIMSRTKAVVTLEHMPAREVRDEAGVYKLTGRLQPVHVYVSDHVATAAAVWKGLETRPPPFAVTIERPVLPVPLSDAAGYVAVSREMGHNRTSVPFASFISAPLYLIDAGDTLEMVDKDQLSPTAASVTEVIKGLMVAK